VTIRVLVADDQPIVRQGLATILAAEPDVEVVATAADGREALRLAEVLRPDVCLVDVRMPGLDGLELTRRLTTASPPFAVVVITTFDHDAYVYGALAAGARGFLLKDAGPELLAQAVRAAARGEALIAPNVTVRLLSTFAAGAPGPRPPEPTPGLTEREEEVLRGVARGLTNEELASTLRVGLSTVKTHVASLMDKVGARNRVELAIWAYETRRVTPGAAPPPKG
jgi:DNA-binding NarL/FixJ family response regulator